MDNVGPNWGFETIRAAAESGPRGRRITTTTTLVAGVGLVVFGLVGRSWLLFGLGLVPTALATLWIVRSLQAARTAERMAERGTPARPRPADDPAH